MHPFRAAVEAHDAEAAAAVLADDVVFHSPITAAVALRDRMAAELARA